jgi:hypothetical protein
MLSLLFASNQQVQLPQLVLARRQMEQSPAGRLQNSDIQQKSYRSQMTELGCKCPKRPRTPQSTLPRYMAFIFYRTSLHKPECPFYLQENQSTTAGVRYVLSRCGKRYLAEIALTWSATSVSPVLVFRNIVSPYSPAFALLDALYTFLCFTEGTGQYSCVPSVFELVQSCLAKVFRTKSSSPTDTLQDGSTLLHVSYQGL